MPISWLFKRDRMYIIFPVWKDISEPVILLIHVVILLIHNWFNKVWFYSWASAKLNIMVATLAILW